MQMFGVMGIGYVCADVDVYVRVCVYWIVLLYCGMVLRVPVYVGVRVHVCVCACVTVCVVWMCMWVLLWVWTCVCTVIHVSNVCVCLHGRMHVCMCAHVCACMCVVVYG